MAQIIQIIGNIGGGPVVEKAEVGQTIVVKEVDTNGKPTKWEAVDMPDLSSVNTMPGNIEQIAMLAEVDMLPAVHENGAILTDENGNVILRY